AMDTGLCERTEQNREAIDSVRCEVPVQVPLLFLSVFIIATCGLGYELIAGTVASYLLGDSVTQFSTAIGLYLFALGIGAYLSRYLDRDLAARFIDIELAVALLGGAAAGILMLAFAH